MTWWPFGSDYRYMLRPDWTPDGHTNLMLPGEPTDDELEWIRHVFTRPVRNAGRTKK